MNEKITMPRMSVLLADVAGKSQSECSTFLKEFFSIISESLISGENVKIKGFGVFKLLEVESRKSVDVSTGQEMEIPSHTKISFTPAKELAEKVNSSFDFFEVVELNDGVNDELLSEQQDNVEAEDEITVRDEEAISDYVLEDSEELEITEIVEEAVREELIEQVDLNESEERKEVKVDSITSNFVDNTESEVTESHSEVVEEYIPEREEETSEVEEVYHRRKFAKGYLCGFLSAIAIIALVFSIAAYFKVEQFTERFEKSQIPETKEVITENIIEKKVAEVEDTVKDKTKTSRVEESEKSASEVDTQPSDNVVYDMITNTRYLTTMAKDHYGNYNLWPYIYEENKKILGHPNRIKPGTKIVIPSLVKYGVDPKKASDIEKAKKLGAEIYARYN